MTLREIQKQLLCAVAPSEASIMAQQLLMHITGRSLTQLLIAGDIALDDTQSRWLESAICDLQHHKPIQYIIGVAQFWGRDFRCNQATLIPRPETEELVDWILSDHSNNSESLTIVDIGTGTGCIAISLALGMPHASVTATDISAEALVVAKENGSVLGAEVDFIQHDILSQCGISEKGKFDIIVSNPPYIMDCERETMDANVVDYEPHTALFVPDNDPLLFYRAIAQWGKSHLKSGGNIYFEINQQLPDGTIAMLESLGYRNITIRHDLNNNPRMICAEK